MKHKKQKYNFKKIDLNKLHNNYVNPWNNCINSKYNISDNVSKGIVKVPLEDYENAILLINNNEYLETLTSSGKIRLVRERLKLK